MEGDETGFHRRHTKVGCELLVLLALVPEDRLDVRVRSPLKRLLDHREMTIVAPDDGRVERGVLVDEAERLEDVVQLALCVRFRVPLRVLPAILHVPVEQTYQRSVLYL